MLGLKCSAGLREAVRAGAFVAVAIAILSQASQGYSQTTSSCWTVIRELPDTDVQDGGYYRHADVATDGRIAVVGRGVLDYYDGAQWRALMRDQSVIPQDVIIRGQAVIAVGAPQFAGVWSDGWHEVHRAARPRGGLDYWASLIALRGETLFSSGGGSRRFSGGLLNVEVADARRSLGSLVERSVRRPPCALHAVLANRIIGWDEHVLLRCRDGELWSASAESDPIFLGRAPLQWTSYVGAFGPHGVQVLSAARRFGATARFYRRTGSDTPWEEIPGLPERVSMVLPHPTGMIAIAPSRILHLDATACVR